MDPFERFKLLNTEGNIWVYLLALAKEEMVIDEEADNLIFEKFGFLPPALTVKTVLYRLRRKGFIKTDRFRGKRAYQTTEKGKEELEKMKTFCRGLVEKF